MSYKNLSLFIILPYSYSVFAQERLEDPTAKQQLGHLILQLAAWQKQPLQEPIPLRFIEAYKMLAKPDRPLPKVSLSEPAQERNFEKYGLDFSFTKFIDQYDTEKFHALLPSSVLDRVRTLFQDIKGFHPHIIIALDGFVENRSSKGHYKGGFYCSKQNLIVLADHIFQKPTTTWFALLCHEYSHALQATFCDDLADDMFDSDGEDEHPFDLQKFREYDADRTACLRMDCVRCVTDWGNHREKDFESASLISEGYFSAADFQSMIAFLAKKQHYCEDHKDQVAAAAPY